MTYEEQLLTLALADERIVVMTAENRAAIRNLPEKLGNRFIDVGIAEMTMVGAAAGLALRGRKPIIHALATFVTLRAFEFIRDDVGIAQLPVIIVGGVPGFLSDANGPTHQAIEDISLMRGIPGINIFCPADGEELAEALPQLFASNEPWYVRYYAGAPAREHIKKFEIGKAEVYRSPEGTEDEVDVTIFTYGFLLGEALKAQDILHAVGISTDVVNLRTLVPIDEYAILDGAERSQLVVTLEDHFKIGGLYSIISELFQRDGMVTEVLPFALDGKWFKPALLKDVLQYEGFTAEQIVEKIRARLTEVSINDDSMFGDYLSLN
jgi:transketolase